jgi:hypothetical protein
MIFQKLTLKHLIAFSLAIILLGVSLFCGRICLEALQKAYGVDETNAVSGSVQLNRQTLDKAISLLDENNTGEKKEVKKTSALEQLVDSKESSNSSLATNLSEPLIVEIVNASGVTGAAKTVSELFTSKKTAVNLTNNQSLLDETSVFYKNEYRDWKNHLESNLTKYGFKVEKEGKLEDTESVDIRIVLGK